jgi:hypothetical protein
MDEDQTRIEAEARRQRILNQAHNRMDRISGFSNEQQENDDNDDHDNDIAAAAADTGDDDRTGTTPAPAPATTTDVSEEAETEDDAAESKAATARKAKMAAMRRRRFKKPTTTTTETATTETESASSPSSAEPTDDNTAKGEAIVAEENDAEAATTATATTTDVKPPKGEESSLVPTSIDSITEETAAPTAATTTVSPGKLVEEEPAVAETALPPALASSGSDDNNNINSNTSGGGGGKKKYMGVAKMRRKMIKERAATNKNATGDYDDDNDRDDSDNTTTTAQAVATKVLSNRIKQRQKISLYSLPILMEAVVVLLLFAVGLQVGLQQSHVEYTTILVHNGLVVSSSSSPATGGLVRLISFVPDKISAWQQQRLEKKKQNSINHYLLGQDDSATTTATATSTMTMKPMGASEEDEFADDAVGGADDNDDGEENIDPLFGIDLDKITRGPGLVLFLGRLAVKAHRVNLYIFYHVPISIYTTIVSKVWSFVEEPPLLCVAALLIRQFIGKTVLGARIPKEAQIKSRGGDLDENSTDVLTTMKKVVITFITNAFPTLVTMAEGWMHLRADMYVVLFGLFVGWAWHHTDFAAVGDYWTTVDGTGDTHPTAATQSTTMVTSPITDGGATDEL